MRGRSRVRPDSHPPWSPTMHPPRQSAFLCLPLALLLSAAARAEEDLDKVKWVPSTAHVVPKWTATEGEGYFSVIEGLNGRLYIGTHANAVNSWLVEFDPMAEKMKVVTDAHKAIGTDLKGFGAQAKSRACARHVWHLLTDERLREAIVIAENYADGLATREAAEAAAQLAYQLHRGLDSGSPFSRITNLTCIAAFPRENRVNDWKAANTFHA